MGRSLFVTDFLARNQLSCGCDTVDEMNARERFLAALHGEQPDRTPVAHVAAMTTVELQESTGCPMPQVHHDPSAQAKLLAANHEQLGFDAVSFIINYFGEPAALVRRSIGATPFNCPLLSRILGNNRRMPSCQRISWIARLSAPICRHCGSPNATMASKWLSLEK